MARPRLTIEKMVLRAEQYFKARSKLSKTESTVLKLIQTKKSTELNEEDVKRIKSLYDKILKLDRIENLFDEICRIHPNERSTIENDIIEFAGYEHPYFQNEADLKIAFRMLINYQRRVSDDIKLEAHHRLKNSRINLDQNKRQNTRKRKQENYKKFLIGGTFVSFYELHEVSNDLVDCFFEMLKIYEMKKYFQKELFSKNEIDEFKNSKQGREFCNRKNLFLLNIRDKSS